MIWFIIGCLAAWCLGGLSATIVVRYGDWPLAIAVFIAAALWSASWVYRKRT